ncbi:helix-turn-helix transcriptional regulator [Halegenticoccus tardaugens]|uniref:helix-turn-helix transcriptional regulator n=1 Tax=Halegenticoccus tardaugens TaxID=2071624 RepID=UPI00100AB393|nr:MarR family transcriptional regulator [Halegenticoccus tardaugens]
MSAIDRLLRRVAARFGRRGGESERESGSVESAREADGLRSPPADERPRSRAELMLEEGATPAECLLAHVERNGGQIHQKTLVEATRLSPSMVSRTLSELERDGAVVRYRLGRENVVYLPEAEPEAYERANRRR